MTDNYEITAAPGFASLVSTAGKADTGRGGGHAPTDVRERFTLMLNRRTTDPLWARDYEEFVDGVSFAREHEESHSQRHGKASRALSTSLNAMEYFNEQSLRLKSGRG